MNRNRGRLLFQVLLQAEVIFVILNTGGRTDIPADYCIGHVRCPGRMDSCVLIFDNTIGFMGEEFMGNIYDNENFYEEYSKMARSRQGLDGAGERHQLRPMLLLVKAGKKQCL